MVSGNTTSNESATTDSQSAGRLPSYLRQYDRLATTDEREDGQRDGSVTFVETSYGATADSDDLDNRIAATDPDIVAVELDDLRYRELADADTEENVDAGDVLSGKTGYQFLGHWLTTAIENRYTNEYQQSPEKPVETALDSADEQSAAVALVDRDLNDTTQRLWTHLRLRDKLSMTDALTSDFGGPWKVGMAIGLFWGLLFGAILRLLVDPLVLPAAPSVGNATLDALAGPLVSTLDALIVIGLFGLLFGIPFSLFLAAGTRVFERAGITFDSLTDADPVTMVLETYAPSPAAKTKLTDDRDALIAHRLAELQDAGYDVAAVVGSGRRERIETYLANPKTRPPLESVAGPVETGRYRSLIYRVIGYGVTVILVALFLLIALGGTQDGLLLQLFVAWFVVNFVAAAGVAFLAGAHWTSAGVGGAVAWLTSVNPLITPGLFIAYVELQYTKVKLSDIWRMKTLMQQRERTARARLRRMHREIGLFRLLFIMTVANLASFTASVVFVAVILPFIAADVGGLAGLGEELLTGMEDGAAVLREFLL